MADISTHLRELSVGVYFIDPTALTPTTFSKACEKIDEFKADCKISKSPDEFSPSELEIINNGFSLAELISERLNIKNPTTIKWRGLDTQSKSAVDLELDDKKFSLKEKSFILKNMGLYELLNILENSDSYSKGVHIFEKFAIEDLENWFISTRDLLVNNYTSKLNFIGKSGDNSSVEICNNNLIFTYNNETLKLNDFNNISYSQFKEKISTKFKEKCFGKWLKTIEKEDLYLSTKKRCAVNAGNNFISKIGDTSNIDTSKFLRFFRLEDVEYYYAKVVSGKKELYRVPKMVDVVNNIRINSIKADIPKSQLNIITKLKNSDNGKSISFRNELRYSHGQFNGTPEAKLYIEGGDLSIVYENLV